MLFGEVHGRIEKPSLCRNCFLLYGHNPWDTPRTDGFMLCANWKSGNPSTIHISGEQIKARGFDLSKLDGGVSFIQVGSGISSLVGYEMPDLTGDSIEVSRNAVFDFDKEEDMEGLDKKISSVSVTFS